MDKYILCYPNEMNTYYKKGYIFLATYAEYYQNGGGSSSHSGSANGQIGDKQVNLNLNLPVPYPGGLNQTTKIIMELRGPAETLYGNTK